MPYKGFIFDFDGLILDTETPLFDSWQEIYAEAGVNLSLEKYAACVGADFSRFDPATHLFKLTGCTQDAKALHKQANSRSDALIRSLPLRPGVASLLDSARAAGLRMALASSSGRDWIQCNLAERKLEGYFDLIRTAEDVERIKPHPDLYLSAAAGLGLMPGECIAFEDSNNGVRAARLACLACCAVPNPVTSFMDFSLADVILPSLEGYTAADVIKTIHDKQIL